MRCFKYQFYTYFPEGSNMMVMMLAICQTKIEFKDKPRKMIYI